MFGLVGPHPETSHYSIQQPLISLWSTQKFMFIVRLETPLGSYDEACPGGHGGHTLVKMELHCQPTPDGNFGPASLVSHVCD